MPGRLDALVTVDKSLPKQVCEEIVASSLPARRTAHRTVSPGAKRRISPEGASLKDGASNRSVSSGARSEIVCKAAG